MDIVQVALPRSIVERESFREHALRDELAGLTECHLDADWLLVYRVTADEVVLHRTGTHRDVFIRERHPSAEQ